MADSPPPLEPNTVDGPTPACDERRPYKTFGSFFLTITTLGASAWVFLIGSVLPSIGDIRLVIIGFICGLLIGASVCVLGVALPAFRYGFDSVGISKAFLGVRGALLPLGGVLLTALAWAAVVNSMIARGFVFLVFGHYATVGASDKSICFGLYVVGLILCWLLLRGGYQRVQRISNWVGPGFLLVAVICFILLVARFGFSGVWISETRTVTLTNDPHMSLAYALELGLSFSLAWWPFIGDLYRMMMYRRHTVNPFMLGTICGAGFCSTVAALGAIHYDTADPVVWIVRLAGPQWGTLIVAVVLIMNIPSMALLTYFAAAALRELGAADRVGWDYLVAIALVPVALGAWDTDGVLVHVTAIATYGGLMFLSVSAIAVVDFYILRRGNLNRDDLLGRVGRGHYWFWGGVNWIAILVLGLGVIAYLATYDPISMHAKSLFRYLGAGVPIMLVSGILYFLLMRALMPVFRLGGYDTRRNSSSDTDGAQP